MSEQTRQRLAGIVDLDRYPLDDPALATSCHIKLEYDGALVLSGFFTKAVVDDVLSQSLPRIDEAFFTINNTHNVYLTPADAALPDNHTHNRQMTSTKGCLAHDQVASSSPLQTIYDAAPFQQFLCGTLGITSIHPYADTLSGINVHFHLDGQELGWHFDNSSFAVTTLMQPPESGGVFEYVPNIRDADAGDQNFDGVAAVLDSETSGNKHQSPSVKTLHIEPGDLVLFRGRNSMHRVTPSRGATPRVLVVFAYNTEPGVGLSESAKSTFYGRSK